MTTPQVVLQVLREFNARCAAEDEALETELAALRERRAILAHEERAPNDGYVSITVHAATIDGRFVPGYRLEAFLECRTCGARAFFEPERIRACACGSTDVHVVRRRVPLP